MGEDIIEIFDEDLIMIDPKSWESIGDALETLTQKIDDYDFKVEIDGYDEPTCITKLSNGQIVKLDISDIKNSELINEVLKITAYNSIEELRETHYGIFSILVVLSLALENEDLNKPVYFYILQILKITRELAFNEELWIDSIHIFGIESLVLFALVYPEFSYFIADYLSKDWDSEHASYAYECLPALRDKWGYDKNILKALAHCRNLEAFSYLTTSSKYYISKDSDKYQHSLFNHFQSNPTDYHYFKTEYISFVKKKQFVERNTDSSSRVEEIIRIIAPNMSEDEWKTKLFVDDTFENEVAIFSAEVDTVVEKDFRKARYKASRTNSGYNAESFRFELSGNKSEYDLTITEEQRKLNIECLNEKLEYFCKSSIAEDDSLRGDRIEEREFVHKQDCDLAYKFISEYLLEGKSFEKIESIVIPKFYDSTSDSLDEIIWSLDEEIRHRALYMFGCFNDQWRLYEYWYIWNEKVGGGIALDFFKLLIEIGVELENIFNFILFQYIRKVDKLRYSKHEFAQLFHEVYADYDLYEILHNLPSDMIVFALQQVAHNKNIRSQIEKFKDHKDRKVRDEASIILEN